MLSTWTSCDGSASASFGARTVQNGDERQTERGGPAGSLAPVHHPGPYHHRSAQQIRPAGTSRRRDV
ncbi:hypothetical protein [Microbacterium sp.]|uniref:hypothetical protein n=1 Tax=Microbacterium sp. TaxID=51671 RepID=UPI003735C87D